MFEKFRCFRLDCFFEFIGIVPGHTVPSLGLSPVHYESVIVLDAREILTVVDRIGVVILVVPAESREEHSKVDPRNCHS